MYKFDTLKARLGARMALRGIPEARGLRLTDCIKISAETAVFTGLLDGRPVVVKQMRGPDAAARAGAQADELFTQHPRMDTGPYRVPEPLFAVPQKGIVVMERATGRRLDRAIRADPVRRADYLREAGAWLAHYIGPRRGMDAFGGNFWIKTRRQALHRAEAGPDRDRVAGLVELMKRERARIGEGQVTRARSHGDFAPINLLIDEEIVWGVDIQNSAWLALAKDLARFLVYLEITLPHGRSDGPCGLAAEDVEALLGPVGLLDPAEADLLLPYFVAVELSGRLLTETAYPDIMENARRLADRILLV